MVAEVRKPNLGHAGSHTLTEGAVLQRATALPHEHVRLGVSRRQMPTLQMTRWRSISPGNRLSVRRLATDYRLRSTIRPPILRSPARYCKGSSRKVEIGQPEPGALTP
jgi:hypothetical protein